MIPNLRNDPWMQGAAMLIAMSVLLTFMCLFVGAWKAAPFMIFPGVVLIVMVLRRRPS